MLTGGGSALMPAPVPGVSLADKIQLTRLLSAAGANIEQLNAVRRPVSLVKGGGLARACAAGRLITLVISDVLGDPLETIASGPTVTDRASTAGDALDVLQALGLIDEPAIGAIVRYLRRGTPDRNQLSSSRATVSHVILGNNATAVDAAGMEAERVGYSHAMISASKAEGAAEDVGRHLANMALQMRREPGPDCLISGGEPTVTLVEEARRGKGGRNQQLALAALAVLGDCEGIAMLAAGTDGEDGPTDAAGAFVTHDVAMSAQLHELDASDYLARNDAYNFFRQVGGSFITGPTQTNVCDLRILVVDQYY
jgi:glycerate-2-kinase